MEDQGTRYPAGSLDSVPDEALLRRLGELVSQSRRVEVDLVSHVGEVEGRRLYAREAFPSMFAYCTEALHLSEAEAYLRIRVARAAREHPPLLTMLGDGRLHLSGIAKLVPVLTPQNRDVLLERATHRSKRRILELVAELSPRPDAPSAMRRLPQRGPGPSSSALQGAHQVRRESEVGPDRVGPAPKPTNTGGSDAVGTRPRPTTSPVLDRADARFVELGPDAVEPLRPAGSAGEDRGGAKSLELGPDAVGTTAIPAGVGFGTSTGSYAADDDVLVSAPATHLVAPPAPSRPAVVEPLSPARYKVQFTASADLHDKLERLQALMRFEVPDGDLAAIIERAVTEKIERIEARRYARTSAPRQELKDTDTAPTSRHIPAAVRRAVRERDGDRCRYFDESGRRCCERSRLEFHHRHPFGMGGDHSPANLRLLCASHNRHLAEYDYGRNAIRRRHAEPASASQLHPAGAPLPSSLGEQSG